MERTRKILTFIRKAAASVIDAVVLKWKIPAKPKTKGQKVILAVGSALVALLLLAQIVAMLILRPVIPPKPLSIPKEELQSIQKTSAKFSGAILRGRRQPQKSVVVMLSAQETQALLSSARRVFNPHLRKKVYLRDVVLRDGKLLCHAEIPVNYRWMIPVEITADGKIADGKLRFDLKSVRMGMMRVPVFPFQGYVDRELNRFGETDEGKILASFVRRADFTPEGGMKIEATSEGFKFLREKLCNH